MVFNRCVGMSNLSHCRLILPPPPPAYFFFLHVENQVVIEQAPDRVREAAISAWRPSSRPGRWAEIGGQLHFVFWGVKVIHV